jgi:hypothetical protein
LPPSQLRLLLLKLLLPEGHRLTANVGTTALEDTMHRLINASGLLPLRQPVNATKPRQGDEALNIGIANAKEVAKESETPDQEMMRLPVDLNERGRRIGIDLRRAAFQV